MGVETLWFMPVTPIAQLHKKGSLGSPYACSDYVSVNPEFGNLEDFKNLINIAHSMSLKVMIDWVANHTGWDHVWTISNPEYYQKDRETGTFKIASGMDDIIELDYSNPVLRNAMIAAMRFWITETNIDGFRCDLASWVTVDFWLEARKALEQTKNLFWLGEFDPIDSPEYMHVFDAAYTWKWMHSTEDFYKKHLPLHTLTDLLKQYSSDAGKDSIKLWFTSNHDENSWNGTEYEKYGEAALLFAVHSFTWDGIPLVYSGQELPNHKRLPFFEKGIIEWTGVNIMSEFYSTLYNLRKNNPALKTADAAVKTYIINTNAPDNVLAYLRKSGADEVLVILNFTNAEIDVVLSDEVLTGIYSDVFHDGEKLDIQRRNSIKLMPWQHLLFEKR